MEGCLRRASEQMLSLTQVCPHPVLRAAAFSSLEGPSKGQMQKPSSLGEALGDLFLMTSKADIKCRTIWFW